MNMVLYSTQSYLNKNSKLQSVLFCLSYNDSNKFLELIILKVIKSYLVHKISWMASSHSQT